MSDALDTVKRYLTQKLDAHDPVDWQQVYFETKHLNNTGHPVAAAIRELPHVKAANASVVVVLASSKEEMLQGLAQVQFLSKPILVIAKAGSLSETKAMWDELTLQQQQNFPGNAIRFDFLDPTSTTRGEDLHALIKEEAAAAVAGSDVPFSQFQIALEIHQTELGLGAPRSPGSSTTSSSRSPSPVASVDLSLTPPVKRIEFGKIFAPVESDDDEAFELKYDV